jgi:hypothetical protein
MKGNTKIDRLSALIRKFLPRHETGDDVWEFHLPIGRKWHTLWAKRYRDSFFLGGSEFDYFETGTSETPGGAVLEQTGLAAEYGRALERIHRDVARDPLGYHRALCRSLPPGLRKGVIHRKFVHALIPEYMRFDRELTRRELAALIRMLKSHEPDASLPGMTGGRFFEYCRAAYLANPKTHVGAKGSGLSGQAMYKKWADGRDGGLSDLPLEDEAAFEKWYREGAATGGHPWEVFRGGNSTHIDLYVRRESPEKGWQIQISAFSSTRLAEACRMALAFQAKGLPFRLDHRDSYLRRLLAEDYVGVVPEGGDIKYGWHQFPKEFNVSDCIHFPWFKDDAGKSLRPMREIKDLVTWFPIEPLAVV